MSRTIVLVLTNNIFFFDMRRSLENRLVRATVGEIFIVQPRHVVPGLSLALTKNFSSSFLPLHPAYPLGEEEDQTTTGCLPIITILTYNGFVQSAQPGQRRSTIGHPRRKQFQSKWSPIDFIPAVQRKR